MRTDRRRRGRFTALQRRNPAGQEARAAQQNRDRKAVARTDQRPQERAPVDGASRTRDAAGLDPGLRGPARQEPGRQPGPTPGRAGEPDREEIQRGSCGPGSADRGQGANESNYSPPRTQIDLEAAVDHHRLSLVVRDRGPGISQADRRRPCTSFFRAKHVAACSTSGAGLGLVISRRIVDLHGGSISIASSIASQEGVGSTFRVLITGVILLPDQASDGEPNLLAASDPATVLSSTADQVQLALNSAGPGNTLLKGAALPKRDRSHRLPPRIAPAAIATTAMSPRMA